MPSYCDLLKTIQTGGLQDGSEKFQLSNYLARLAAGLATVSFVITTQNRISDYPNIYISVVRLINEPLTEQLD